MPTTPITSARGQGAEPGVPCRAAEHPQRQDDQRPALQQCRARAPNQSQADHTEADGVVRSVTQEIQRVGLQGGRAGGSAGHDLGQEEPGIDRERDPQRSAPARAVQHRLGAGAVCIMAAGHGVTSTASIGTPRCTL